MGGVASLPYERIVVVMQKPIRVSRGCAMDGACRDSKCLVLREALRFGKARPEARSAARWNVRASCAFAPHCRRNRCCLCAAPPH